MNGTGHEWDWALMGLGMNGTGHELEKNVMFISNCFESNAEFASVDTYSCLSANNSI